jgi:hypothetical protein
MQKENRTLGTNVLDVRDLICGKDREEEEY